MSAFLAALRSGRVLLMDGAMGTELQRAGAKDGECLEAWNVAHPHKIQAIHRAYVEAGAEVLLTNTFQANPAKLARAGMEDRLQEIVQAGIHLARQANGSRGFVLTCFGPTASSQPKSLEPALAAAAGADGILLETFSNPEQAAALVAAHRAGPLAHLPVLVSFTFQRSGPGNGLATFQGQSAHRCAKAAQDMGADGLGANCGRDLGVDDFLEILRVYRGVTDLPLFVRPNAGTPRVADGPRVYPRSADEMAAWVPALFEAGIRMIGGCCGTAPAHVRAFARQLAAKPQAACPPWPGVP